MIAAIVVGFFPDFNILNPLLLTLINEVDLTIFVDNGGGSEFLTNHPEGRSKVAYINLNGNQGLGFALNEGFKLADEHGCQYVATFDQDSAPPKGMIGKLYTSHQEMVSKHIKCAAIAPIFFDHREGEKKRFPFYREIEGKIKVVPNQETIHGLIETDVLITSGMLVAMQTWKDNVKYDASLFVDYTDTDWCFRARAKGYKLYANLDVEMGHAPSDAPPARIFGLSFFRYSPLRRYYYFRNTVFFIKQKYVSKAWKKRLFKGIFLRYFVNLLIDDSKYKSFKMMTLGIKHGCQNKSGDFSKI